MTTVWLIDIRLEKKKTLVSLTAREGKNEKTKHWLQALAEGKRYLLPQGLSQVEADCLKYIQKYIIFTQIKKNVEEEWMVFSPAPGLGLPASRSLTARE